VKYTNHPGDQIFWEGIKRLQEAGNPKIFQANLWTEARIWVWDEWCFKSRARFVDDCSFLGMDLDVYTIGEF